MEYVLYFIGGGILFFLLNIATINIGGLMGAGSDPSMFIVAAINILSSIIIIGIYMILKAIRNIEK